MKLYTSFLLCYHLVLSRKINMSQQAELEENNPQELNQCNKVSMVGTPHLKSTHIQVTGN